MATNLEVTLTCGDMEIKIPVENFSMDISTQPPASGMSLLEYANACVMRPNVAHLTVDFPCTPENMLGLARVIEGAKDTKTGKKIVSRMFDFG
jgi:hypothetical protein